MLGAPVENQKMDYGAMVRMQELDLDQLYLKQKKQQQHLCVCASKQRRLLTVMDLIGVCKIRVMK
jgi:hypothetical protein